MKNLSIGAKLYIAATITAAGVLLAWALPQWTSNQSLRFSLYFACALLASNLKVILPGITGTMSVNFLFVLISVMDLNLPQVILISYAGTAGQVLFRAKTRQPVRLLFNLSSTTLSTIGCYSVYHSASIRSINASIPILLLFASGVLFLINTLSISGIIALAERKNLWRVWNDGFCWTASHHLVGAGVAAVFRMENQFLGWEASVLTLPVVYFVYRSYSLHLGRLEAARKHAAEMGDLHWRAIEALALAIDAKDETTHDHLLRVKVYAAEIAKELSLTEPEMQAVQAAALLHDIGKLAVPEYIISKPGKLTPEEFEKMKVHPVVGAEILERVRFPYPVVPIVRCHHEKWNGKGYPAGLKGEEIPIGARILAVVDCLDALASDRQYRRALPLDEAMAIVASESGTSFDPKIVSILQRRYADLERMATSSSSAEEPKLSRNLKVVAGGGPASGYAESQDLTSRAKPLDSARSPAAARQEFQSLLKLIEELGSSLGVDETCSLLMFRLKRMVPHDCLAIFVRDEGRLRPAFVSGEDARWLARSQGNVGEGLTGWVVENHKPILNGNPAVEPGYPGFEKGGRLRSALSVPLEVGGRIVGALSLYATRSNAFTEGHLGTLASISPRVGLLLENALQHQQTAASAGTDILTGLPNTQSLILHLDTEVNRAEQNGSSLALLRLTLDGLKNVKNEFGQFRGNRLLQRVSEGLSQNCRGSDYIARTGTDEFILVLPGMCAEDLHRKIEKLALAVEDAGLEECGYLVLNLSAGPAIYPLDGRDSETLLAHAENQFPARTPTARPSGCRPRTEELAAPSFTVH